MENKQHYKAAQREFLSNDPSDLKAVGFNIVVDKLPTVDFQIGSERFIFWLGEEGGDQEVKDFIDKLKKVTETFEVGVHNAIEIMKKLPGQSEG